ncbi:hypothetical protein GCM10027185_60290 [Spirosoma pulveris]
MGRLPFRLRGATGDQLAANNGAFWRTCNLPEAGKRKGLAIYVSSYSLPGLELERTHRRPIPFESTGSKFR